uniref:Uncharacterized protein n=1 Tax=Cacopsylla melanoneura TaxID=428564 RepID=A0A8D8TQA4_9HEMI
MLFNIEKNFFDTRMFFKPWEIPWTFFSPDIISKICANSSIKPVTHLTSHGHHKTFYLPLKGARPRLSLARDFNKNGANAHEQQQGACFENIRNYQIKQRMV